MKKNILITSASAKVLLVRAFKDAARRYDARVYSGDVREKCAAALEADAHLTLMPSSDPESKAQLLELLDAHDIGLIVPTRDGELADLADLRADLCDDQTRILCCSSRSLADVQNKVDYSNRIEALGYRALPRVSPDTTNLEYPLFTRPISGAAGAGAYKISSPEDLPPRETWADRLFHPFINAREYSIDVLMGLTAGQAIQCVVRERVEVRGGEAKVSTIVSHAKLEDEAMDIAVSLGLVGHNVMQAFVTDEDEILHIETNPRFGGASNLSIQSGLDSPARLLALHFGAPPETVLPARKIAVGATMYRYAEDFIEV